MNDVKFWTRELAGWILVALGLLILYLCLGFLNEHKIIEAGPVLIIGVIVFRGGISLLRVAIAGRISTQALARDQPAYAGRSPERPPERSLDQPAYAGRSPKS